MARLLAAATGPKGRRVTPSGALAPGEVPGAAAVLGTPVQAPVRRAADVPDVHRGWLMAIGAGMVRIDSGCGFAVDGAGATVDDASAVPEVLSSWLEGLLLVCADASGRRYPQALRWLALLVVEILLRGDGPGPDIPVGYALSTRVRRILADEPDLGRAVDGQRLNTWLSPAFPKDEGWRLFGLLADAGALRGTTSAPQVTALGRWLGQRLREQAPVQILPDWPAQAVLEHQDLGPHARQRLSWWDRGPGPRPDDRGWLAAERAAAALAGAGPDEALAFLADGFPSAGASRAGNTRPDAQDLLAALPGSGHLQAGEVTAAVTAFLDSGAPPSIGHQLEVTVRLSRWRPATWRRVLIPATDSLGTLSWTIKVLFGWGGDHLHAFKVGSDRFTDPSFPLEEAGDEYDARLSRLFAAGKRKFTYTYDLGACWEHEIVLNRLVPTGPGLPTLRCVAFAGDSPLEYPMLEDEDGQEIENPVLTRPFRLDKVNATLASGHYLVDDDEIEDDEVEDR